MKQRNLHELESYLGAFSIEMYPGRTSPEHDFPHGVTVEGDTITVPHGSARTAGLGLEFYVLGRKFDLYATEVKYVRDGNGHVIWKNRWEK